MMEEVNPVVNVSPEWNLITDIADNNRLSGLTEVENLTQRVLHWNTDGAHSLT